ncbi:MAG: DUF2800 domain-containing protein [Ilumatobacteraceae bacterium]
MNELTTTERPHAERSASQLPNLLGCAGFKPLKGSRTHWVTEQGNRGHWALDAGHSDLLESDFEERMVAACERYASQFIQLGTKVYNEVKVDTVEGRWGYTDRLMVHLDGTADLLDWKFVRSKLPADADFNMQGKDYVIGILQDARFANVQAIRVHFVAPRLNFVTFSEKPFTRADLPRLKLEVLAILARARHTDSRRYRGASLTPNYNTCRYCAAAGTCVALRRIADEIGRKYDPEGYGKTPAIPQQTHASLVTDPAQKAQLQELAGIMETWAASVRHHNLSAALDDEKNLPAGYVLDWSKGRRRITDASSLLSVAKEFGLTSQELIEAASLSWTKVEDALRAKAARGEKSAIVGQFDARLTELGAVERPEPTPKLVRSRPARA